MRRRPLARPWAAPAIVAALLVAAVTIAPAGAGAAGTTSPSPAPGPSLGDVRAFVDRAVTFAADHGRDAALAAFTDPGGPFHDGELYIYAYDMGGTVIAHGGDPTLVGRDLIAKLDPDGLPVIGSLVRLARQGGGWLAYRWPNPATGEVSAPKIGYVRPVDETWFLGSGAYGEAALPPTEADARAFLAAAHDALGALPRDEAIAAIADPTGPFDLGALRVVAYDRHGVVLADPGQPDLVGRATLDRPGPDGGRLLDAVLAAVDDPSVDPVALSEVVPAEGWAVRPLRLVVSEMDGTWFLAVTYPADE